MSDGSTRVTVSKLSCVYSVDKHSNPKNFWIQIQRFVYSSREILPTERLDTLFIVEAAGQRQQSPLWQPHIIRTAMPLAKEHASPFPRNKKHWASWVSYPMERQALRPVNKLRNVTIPCLLPKCWKFHAQLSTNSVKKLLKSWSLRGSRHSGVFLVPPAAFQSSNVGKREAGVYVD